MVYIGIHIGVFAFVVLCANLEYTIAYRITSVIYSWFLFCILFLYFERKNERILSIPGVGFAADYMQVFIAENDDRIAVGTLTDIAGWISCYPDLDAGESLSELLEANGATSTNETWRVWLGGNGISSGDIEVKANVGLMSTDWDISRLRNLSDAYSGSWSYYILEPVRESQGGSPLPSYEVKFLDYDGNVFAIKYVRQNSSLLKYLPKPNPTIKDFTFTQWYTDAALTQAPDPMVGVKEDMVLYSGWAPYEPPVYTTPEDADDVSNMREVSHIKERQIVITMGADTMSVFGRSVPLDAPAYMQDGIPMLPVRAVLEQIGMKGMHLFTWSEEEMDSLLLHTTMGDYKIENGSDVALGTYTQLAMIPGAMKVNGRFYIPFDTLGRLYNISAKWNDLEDKDTVVLTLDAKAIPKY